MGLRVIHKGSRDLGAPPIFGMRLSDGGETVLTFPRWTIGASVSLDFVSPGVLGRTEVFTFELGFDDVVVGASPGMPIHFRLRVDGEPPSVTGPLPQGVTITNRSMYGSSLVASDGSGSGMDPRTARARLACEDGPSLWYDVDAVMSSDGSCVLSATVPLPADGDYVLLWLVRDMVGNELLVEVELIEDSTPPSIHLVGGREWYNTTAMDLSYVIKDAHLLGLAPTDIAVRTSAGDEVTSALTGVGRDGDSWTLSMDLATAGGYWVSVTVRDEAGNSAAYASRVNIDVEPPRILPRISSLLNATDGRVAFTVHVDDGDGSGVEGRCLEYPLRCTMLRAFGGY
jgi:hypothetical protein